MTRVHRSLVTLMLGDDVVAERMAEGPSVISCIRSVVRDAASEGLPAEGRAIAWAFPEDIDDPTRSDPLDPLIVEAVIDLSTFKVSEVSWEDLSS